MGSNPTLTAISLSTGTRVMAEAEKMRFYAEHYGSWDKAKSAVLSGCPLLFQHSPPYRTFC